MAPHLLDTNIASQIIKGSMPQVDRRLAKVPVANVFISTVTEAELRYGVARLPKATRLAALVEDFLLMVNILPWDSEAARHYGRVRAKLEHDGLPIANLDLMIGAHALAMGATLVTADRAFRRIKDLKIADWTRA
jgi:tRNA(fMet)-specific endonuclease VapC